MNYIHHPVSSIDHDVSETEAVSAQRIPTVIHPGFLDFLNNLLKAEWI
jgi:hypothetical protein